MGSDLHMSPPTPDERVIVRAGDQTAVYSRHTDGIYGDTTTWTRLHWIGDSEGAALNSLKAVHPDWKIVTIPADVVLGEKMTNLPEPDRDWDHEEEVLRSKFIRAKQRMESAHADFLIASDAFEQFMTERRKAKA